MSDVITSAVPFEHPEETGPVDPHEINPKMASDIAYWSKALGVTGTPVRACLRQSIWMPWLRAAATTMMLATKK